MEIENTYETDDIQLASFLLIHDIKLIEVKENSPFHVSFILSDPEKCQELKINYLNNASAPARELFSRRKMLITEIKMNNEYKYGN